MNNNLKTANEILLDSAGLVPRDLEALFSTIVTDSMDFADAYFQELQSESWLLEDGIIKRGSFAVHRGMGVRAVSGEKTGFAYADEISGDALRKIARTASGIVRRGCVSKIEIPHKVSYVPLYSPINPLAAMTEEAKINLLKLVDQEARRDSRVKQVMANLAGAYEVVLVVGSDGRLVEDVRPMVRLNVSVVVEDNGRRESGAAGGGKRGDYSYFVRDELGLHYAREALRIALVNLDAVPAPAGIMPVVLGKGWPAVLLHEAVGHGLEGDFIRKKSSVFSGKIGEKVAASCCTVIDQGNFPGERRGSLNVDDEGTETQRTVLIENGILKNYMLDKLNARLLKMKTTGNSRRESYAHIPLPRMTNTYMLAGKYAPEEIIASVDYGLYAPNFSGGQVDITSGEFVFSTSEAYLIKNGKIAYPVKGATLIGNGPKVLTKISMVGNDLMLDSGVGSCGKNGQSVPVGVGQPTLKVDELVVGGVEQ